MSLKVSDKKFSTKGEEQPSLISPVALGMTSLISDFSGKIRNASRFTHLFFGREQPITLVPLSITSTFALVLGPLNARSQWKEMQLSKKIDDQTGKHLSLLKCLGGIADTVSGVFYIPLRFLDLALYYTRDKSVVIAGRLFGIGALGIGAIPAFFNAIGSSFKIYQLAIFRQRLFSREPKKAVQLLEKELRVNKREKRSIEKSVLNSAKYLYASEKKQHARMKKLKGRLKLKKERALTRMVSKEAVSLIKNAQEKTAVVFDTIAKENADNLKLNAIILTLSILTVAGVTLGLVFTGGIGAIVAAALLTVVALTWFGIDGYNVIEAFKKDERGKYDRLWMIISSLICFIALTLAFYLSAGMIPLILAGVIGLFWLMINSSCLYRLSRPVQPPQILVPMLPQ
jgi:hypothetical protein